MKARRLTTTVLAAALVATSCSSGTPSSTAAAPPPPPVVDTINVGAAFPDDGLIRLIVTPAVGAPTESTAPRDLGGDEPAARESGTSDSIDSFRVLTPEMVAAMPPGVALEVRDGQVGYVNEDGTFVAFDPATAVPVTAEPDVDVDEPAIDLLDAPMSYGNPYIDQLATNPAVKHVTVIGDGTFGVTVSDPTVIDAQIFAVAEDVPLGITVDQYEPYQWALENDGTNLDRVTEIAQTADADLDATPTIGRADGKGITVAVIDSGVDFSHPDLENSMWSNLNETCGNGIDDDSNGYVDDCTGWDFGNNDSSPYNTGADAHGTHVSGIITANRDGQGIAGIAPRARIMDLNVASGSGTGMSISGAAVTAAIRYAVDNGADIINMSLGSQPGTPASAVEPMGDAIDYANSNGVLVVVAAGNNSIDLGSLAVYPASFNRSNMIVVGASTPTDTRAEFSNHNAAIVDVYAPGLLMLSTVPGDTYRFMSGTSQASPATAAAAALVMQTNPEASLDLVIDAVTSTADRSDALSTSAVSGRINAAAAIGEGDAPPIPTELEVSVSGITSGDNQVEATVEIVTPPEVFDEEHSWELTLLSTTDNGVYAIIDHPFVVDGAATATGENGAIELGGAAVTTVPVATNLPAGRYSFVIEAVPIADTSFRLGEAFVTTFQIDGDEQYDGTSPTTVPLPDASTPTSALEGSDGPTSTIPGSSTGDGGGTQDGSSTSTRSGSSDTPTTTAGDAVGGGSDGEGSDSSGSGDGTTPTASGGTDPDDAASGTTPGASPSTTAPSGDATDAADPSDGDPNNVDPSDPGDTASDNMVPDTPAPIPTGVGSGAAKKGAWESTSVSPQAGYIDQATTVVIRGNFPSATYVWFGDQPGQVVHQNRSAITVRTPLRAEPDVVDVTLQKSSNGVVLTIPDAYAFVAFDGTVPGTEDSPDQTDGSTNPGDATDDSESGSGDSGSGDPAPGDGTGDTGADDDGSDEADTTSDRRARMTVGSAVQLPNGLQGASVTPNVAAGVVVCSTDPCVAIRR